MNGKMNGAVSGPAADVCVVGAGPAGLAAAIHAAGRGRRVILLERNDQAGVKLLATGGGRANVTNALPEADWPARFGAKGRGRFILPALRRLPRDSLLAWLRALGQPARAPDGVHFFPESNSARALRDALLAEALRLGVTVRFGSRVMDLREAAALAPAVVLATGGRSYPATGSTWDGCRMAEGLGHRIVRAVPGLVGLHSDNLDAGLAGLVLPRARVLFRRKGHRDEVGEGELLLTHAGISGPVVLDLSASVAEAIDAADAAGEAIISIRWLAGLDRSGWLARFADWRQGAGGARLSALLREFFPARLAGWLCRVSGAEDLTPSRVTASGREALAAALADFPCRVVGTAGWEQAMVTRGGIDVREINPENMLSRLVPWLYFAGETVDVDGPCGGFNLHWALASGARAGEAAAEANL